MKSTHFAFASRSYWLALACTFSALGCGAADKPGDESAAAAGSAAVVATQQQLGLSGSLVALRDTSVQQSAPNANSGTTTSLNLNRTLVDFGGSAITSAVGHDYVVSATLELPLIQNPLRRTPRGASAFRLTQNWTEAGATWNCAIDSKPSNTQADCSGSNHWSMSAAPNPWATPPSGSTAIPASLAGVARFDVSADVRSVVAGQNPSFGWMIAGSAAGERSEFSSRESATPPHLTLSLRRCDPTLCDDDNACTADSCDATANCVHSPVANGASCDDGDACTQSDSCQGGACVPGTSVACVALDSCHVPGTCDSDTGHCDNPPALDGTVCSDANACTQTDSCHAGVCTPGVAVACAATDGCHPGVCDTGTGACSNPQQCNLYGVGALSQTLTDGLVVSPQTLEDGLSSNLVGGLGSAISYTGVGNLYVATPDRGPNNGLDSYSDRYYQIELDLSGGTVSPHIVGAATLKREDGTPFTGFSAAFDATGSSASLRLDPEGVRVSPQGTLFVSDEYGPYVYEFGADGKRLRSLNVPSKFLIAHPDATNELPPANTSGRQLNRGMEGLAISPDGTKLYGLMQNPLIQDGALNGSNARVGLNVRLLEIELASGATREFLYPLSNKAYGLNELVAVNDHQFLAIERDGNAGTSAAFKQLFLIDTTGATDISGIAALPTTGTPSGVTPVSKTAFLNLLAPEYGLAGVSFPEKIEGLAFGPDLPDGRHVLVVTNDNDFLTAGNPDNFYVFAIGKAALPEFHAPQPPATFPSGCSSVTCTPTDQCHLAGSCDPASGACSDPTKLDGTSCDDANANTVQDACAAGVCRGTDLCAGVTCVAADACHVVGSCDHQTGACSNPANTDGTGCDDGNLCTLADACHAGICGGNPVVCNALDQCHSAGTCDPGSGVCGNPALADGAACNDASACTVSDTCQAGVCNGSPLTCAAMDACHTTSCDPATGCSQSFISSCRILRGVVAGSFFTSATLAVRGSSAASTYAGAKVCIDEDGDFTCGSSENSATTDTTGAFTLSGVQQGALVAEIAASALNGGHALTQRLVLRATAQQVQDSLEDPSEDPPSNYFVVVSPLSTEVGRMMADDGADFATTENRLAGRLGVAVADLLRDPVSVTPVASRTAMLNESTILTNRFGLAAKMFDRGGIASMQVAQQGSMNLEGIPRYDHVFAIVLENREAVTIKNNAFAPNINAYLNAGNQFSSYYSTGNPSEPNRVAITAGDDFGITDDNAWNCVDKTANNPEEPQPAGLATCSNATNHNIKNRPNLLSALTAGGMMWRVYNESLNPGRDVRLNGIADTTLKAPDHIYAAGSPVGAIGNPNLMVTLGSQLYATKHNESLNFQAVRSAPEFFDSNRTLGGGQWDAAIMASPSTPAGWNVDQFASDLASGDVAQLNYLEPDQCDDMHGATINGPISTGGTGTASDCSGNALIYRSDLYTDALIKKIKASPVWTNPNKRVAIIIMFDEGTVTTGTFSCCGWNPGGKATGIPTLSGSSTVLDTSVANYKAGNKGHSYSIHGVLTNQAAAPKGLTDSDAYSHISLVRTFQNMFQLSDPGDNWTYMNRSKYTESFIAANILLLPEYAGSADTHFDAVRPMNHQYVIAPGYVQKNGYPASANKQTGPDTNQTNLWALKP